jgi:hypothetical protein
MQIRSFIRRQLGLCRGQLRFRRTYCGFRLRPLRHEFRCGQPYNQFAFVNTRAAIDPNHVYEPCDLGIDTYALKRQELCR